jgi:hypothetical protein
MSAAPACQCDAPRCEREGCHDTPTVYLCHECGSVLSPSMPSTMLYCLRCRKRRRVPTHPVLVSVRP